MQWTPTRVLRGQVSLPPVPLCVRGLAAFLSLGDPKGSSCQETGSPDRLSIRPELPPKYPTPSGPQWLFGLVAAVINPS
jgi:hypothetical protein